MSWVGNPFLNRVRSTSHRRFTVEPVSGQEGSGFRVESWLLMYHYPASMSPPVGPGPPEGPPSP